MVTVIPHAGPDPYPVARAIDRALEGQGWRVVPMFAEAGHAIRITHRGASLFGPDVLVLVEGEQLVIGDDVLEIVPIPPAVEP